MIRLSLALALIIVISICLPGPAKADMMTFDRSQWATGDMDSQIPSDSSGNSPNSHVDDFYYYERLPMAMTVMDDSLAAGSAARTYDSALLSLIIAADGLSGTDSMMIYGRRLIRPWSESGVSWNYHHASPDSAWNNAGGDFSTDPATDTVIVDTAYTVGDTLRFHLDTGFVRYLIEYDNYGWLMMAENIIDRATFQVYTEDAEDSAYWPVLTVFYTDGTSNPVFAGRRRMKSQFREVKK